MLCCKLPQLGAALVNATRYSRLTQCRKRVHELRHCHIELRHCQCGCAGSRARCGESWLAGSGLRKSSRLPCRMLRTRLTNLFPPLPQNVAVGRRLVVCGRGGRQRQWKCGRGANRRGAPCKTPPHMHTTGCIFKVQPPRVFWSDRCRQGEAHLRSRQGRRQSPPPSGCRSGPPSLWAVGRRELEAVHMRKGLHCSKGIAVAGSVQQTFKSRTAHPQRRRSGWPPLLPG